MKKLFDLQPGDVDLIEVWDLGGRRVKVVVDINRLEKYSVATVHVKFWTGGGWVHVFDERTQEGLPAGTPNTQLLASLRDRCLTRAVMVLDGD